MSGRERRLISTERLVEPGDLPRYQAAWARLRAEASRSGARAWRFRSARDPQLYVEFLEFGGGLDPREEATIREVLNEMEKIASGRPEEWGDATDPAGGGVV